MIKFIFNYECQLHTVYLYGSSNGEKKPLMYIDEGGLWRWISSDRIDLVEYNEDYVVIISGVDECDQ